MLSQSGATLAHVAGMALHHISRSSAVPVLSLMCSVACSAGPEESTEIETTSEQHALGQITLRPNADVSGAGYRSNVSSSPAYAVLADESDTTYVRSVGSATTGYVTVAYPSANGPVSAAIVEVRAGRSAGLSARARAELLDGDVLVATSPWLTLSNGATDLAAVFDGLALSDGDGLRTRFSFEKLSGTGAVRFQRALLDVTLGSSSTTSSSASSSSGSGSTSSSSSSTGGGSTLGCGDGMGQLQGQFSCVQVIGFSQTRQWFQSAGFEGAVDGTRWELKWAPGSGMSWQDPSFSGWNNAPESPCQSGSNQPDRVVLTISDTELYPDVNHWVQGITGEIQAIRQHYGNIRIDLQPVVGGPNDALCTFGSNTVRASFNHPYIDAAIAQIVAGETNVYGCLSPHVTACSDYADATGHLTSSAQSVVGQQIGSYYASQ